MICSDVISQEDMSKFLKWALADKDDLINAGAFFYMAAPSSDSSYSSKPIFDEQQKTLFLLYNEFASIKRIAEKSFYESTTNASDATGAKTVLATPYRYTRGKLLRDYITDMTNSQYGNEDMIDRQFSAIDASLTTAEKALLDKNSFFSKSSVDTSVSRYSKFFVRINGRHAPVELEAAADSTKAFGILGDSVYRDPIAIASGILNAGTSDSELLLSVLKKIGSGTID